jgi:hypothetical protein
VDDFGGRLFQKLARFALGKEAPRLAQSPQWKTSHAFGNYVVATNNSWMMMIRMLLDEKIFSSQQLLVACRCKEEMA